MATLLGDDLTVVRRPRNRNATKSTPRGNNSVLGGAAASRSGNVREQRGVATLLGDDLTVVRS